MFITFEGIDAAGKSTQATLLGEWLAAQGKEVVLTREPGGTDLGEGVRQLLLEGPHMTPWAEAALFASARAELVERVIRPALDRGAWVVCDRYTDSSVAYQGIGRGLGVGRVLELSLAATRGLLPDQTFVLLIPPEEAARRAGGARDRIEREGEGFLRVVDEAYRGLAAIFPQRIIALDGRRPPEALAEEVRGHLSAG
ncbi:MAG TPA: dTMP kinase [Gaiellaceae bacterium]|jgi:dTMP kinase